MGQQPNVLHNLVDDPARTAEVDRLRDALEVWMRKTKDRALEAFRHRASREAQARFMEETDEALGVRD